VSEASPVQRFFCTLCGREVFKSVPVSRGSDYHCAGCDIDHQVRYTVAGNAYLVKSIPVWLDLNGQTYNALVFAEAR